MQPLLGRLRSGHTLVADGAMGSLLFTHGLPPGDCPESINLIRPKLLEDIARGYLDAGADIIQTNTFGASPLKLAQYGLEDKAEEINRAAVQAVRKAVGDRAYVAASCGPSGWLLKPYGDTDPDQVYDSFLRQARSLIDAGVDMICVETMTDLAEAKLAVSAAKKAAPQTPVTATMTFDPTPRGYFTIMGVDIPAAAAGLFEAGADVVGSNCGNGIDRMTEIAAEFRRATDGLLMIQSNAGLPDMTGGTATYPETPDFMAARVGALLEAGISIIGGCCGTTPAHIEAIRRAVDA